MCKQTVILLTATGVAFAAGISFEGRFLSRPRGCFGKVRSNETEKSSTREAATQTSSEVHFQPRPPITERLRKKNGNLLGQRSLRRLKENKALLKNKNEQLRQRILRLSLENKALKRERNDMAVREAEANMERDKAVRAADEAVRAEKEARCAAQQATLAKDRVFNTRDLWTLARDEAIQTKNEAVRDKNEALRLAREAVRAREIVTLERDRAILDRDEAIRDKEKGKREAARTVAEITFARDKAIADRDEDIRSRYKAALGLDAIEAELKESRSVIQVLVSENMAATFARDRALLVLELSQKGRTRDREYWAERQRKSSAAWLEQVTEVIRLRRALAAVAERNSLRSITMNPPQ